jgi:uncharacterized radical SAM protein YgiQ
VIHNAPNIFGYKKYWAHRFGPAPELPMTLAEMQQLGWDACDVILVTGDAYVDHPSFGMAVIGRVLEAQGFRVGIISQPDWHSAEDFRRLGQPKLFFGVTGGNMDSMVNRYTSDKKIRSNDAYTADGAAGKRPDRAVNVYAHRCREAYKNVPIVIGGIEASLRRIAHYDYWSDKVRKSIILDSKADLLVYGNAERQVVEIAQRLAKGETIADLKGIRGTVHFVKQVPQDWMEKDSTDIDTPGAVISHVNPYQEQPACEDKPALAENEQVIQFKPIANKQRTQTVIRLPDYEAVKNDPILYAHASRVMHGETNPGNARALIQRHGNREVWINPPPLPLTTPEMDGVFDLPYSRLPHKSYGSANIPAFEMIQHSVLIMRGCFGGCSFCSITEHEGRIIQNRSEDSIIREIEAIRDTSPNFTGHISDLGGPTANMWRLACKDPKIEESCRKPSCVYPGICHNLNTDQTPLVKLYRRARKLPGIKNLHCLRSTLRHRRGNSGICQRTRNSSRRRLSEDRPGTHRARPVVENDETGHGHLRSFQADVRQIFQGSRQRAILNTLLHRRPPRYRRQGHAESGTMAKTQRFPRRPSPGLFALADVYCHRHVSFRQRYLAQSGP